MYFHQTLYALTQKRIYDYSDNKLKEIPDKDYSNLNEVLIGGMDSEELPDYIPKCSKIIQGDIPWVQRLTDKNNNNKNVSFYTNAFSDLPYDYYNLPTLTSPYGAINGSSLNYSIIYAGYTNIENAQYGLPYSCANGPHGDIYSGSGTEMSTPCEGLYIAVNDGYKVKFDENKTYKNTSYSFGRLEIDSRIGLKGLFITGTGISYSSDSYDYTGTIPKCISGQSSLWCATYPTVSNIKLLNNLSINVNPDFQGKFNIVKPGFYFVTFNTNVNEEQTPISKLTLRVYKEGDDWTSDTGIKELDNLDAKPLSTNPHKIGMFLSSGTYQIMAKVVDNWTKFGCAASPSKDFSSVNSNCGKCCAGNETIPAFKDNTNCRFCF